MHHSNAAFDCVACCKASMPYMPYIPEHAYMALLKRLTFSNSSGGIETVATLFFGVVKIPASLLSMHLTDSWRVDQHKQSSDEFSQPYELTLLTAHALTHLWFRTLCSCYGNLHCADQTLWLAAFRSGYFCSNLDPEHCASVHAVIPHKLSWFQARCKKQYKHLTAFAC